MMRGANCCGVMVSCAVVVMMMMMMMSEARAMPKGRGSRLSSEDGHMYPLHLDPTAFIPAPRQHPLHNCSISPWAYHVSQDDTLFPPMVSEARCLLKGCLDVNGHEDQSLRSQPIMHQGLRLRRILVPGGGKQYHYRLESRLFAVGCVCIRQAVMTQQ